MFRPYHKIVNESDLIFTKIELDFSSSKRFNLDMNKFLEGEYDT